MGHIICQRPTTKLSPKFSKVSTLSLCLQIAGEHRVFHVDTGADCQQLLRHLTEHPATVPVWRRQRPALMIQAAEFRPLEVSKGAYCTAVFLDASQALSKCSSSLKYLFEFISLNLLPSGFLVHTWDLGIHFRPTAFDGLCALCRALRKPAYPCPRSW